MMIIFCTLPSVTFASRAGAEIINNTDHTCFLIAEENYSGIPQDGPSNRIRSAQGISTSIEVVDESSRDNTNNQAKMTINE